MQWSAIAFLFFVSCAHTDVANPAPIKFEVYLIDKASVRGQGYNELLDSLILAPRPLITDRDLQAYYWPSHEFIPGSHVDSILQELSSRPYMSAGLPFVVVACGERIYSGTFWWGYSNSLPRVPYIEVTTWPGKYKIRGPFFPLGLDLRSDSRIHDALQTAGVLRESQQ